MPTGSAVTSGGAHSASIAQSCREYPLSNTDSHDNVSGWVSAKLAGDERSDVHAVSKFSRFPSADPRRR